MKKFMFIAVLAVTAMIVSCAGGGPITTQEEADKAFEQIYAQYHDSLILTGAKSYTVIGGDTLSAITRKNYGNDNGYYFPLVMLASRDVVLDPDLIEPGMQLTIPDLQRNLNDQKARAELKKFLKDVSNIYDRKDQPTTRDRLAALSEGL
jgi:hypothetical protein